MYYHYFHGCGDEISSCFENPSWKIQIPGITKIPLSKRDLPSFMLPSNPQEYNFVLPLFKEQINALDAEAKPRVLLNTFDSLECEALRAIDGYKMIAVGLLIPSAFLDSQDPTDDSFGGDLYKKSDDCLEWLSSKAEASVVYVSFGSLLRLLKPQMEEIGKVLLGANRPFLWVTQEEEKLSCTEQLEKVGKIVPWCSQLEVLTHLSLGCFVTHCGWKSTLESLSCGVPVVAFPSWADQGTNTKLIEDVWRTSVWVTVNGEGVEESGEIRRCIEKVTGDSEFRKNADKWMDLLKRIWSHFSIKSFVNGCNF